MTGRWIGLAILAVAGCGESVTGPDTPDVSVSLVMVASEEVQSVRVTIENHDAETIMVRCGAFTLEGLTIEGWQPVRGQTCIGTPPWVEVGSNDSRSVEFGAPGGGNQYRGAVRFRSGESETEEWIAYSEPVTF